MKTGIVAGDIVSTINHGFYDGRKMLIVDLVDATGRRTGKELVAVDVAGAGPGETVLILDEGNGARQVFGSTDAPVRSVIVGIIDRMDLDPA